MSVTAAIRIDEVLAGLGLRHLRVLLVDDDPTVRLLVTKMLHRQGHDPIVAENGLEAVELFESEDPDIVLMDVNMPMMNGHETTRRIKALAGENFVPVIFLTAEEGISALSRCLEAGGDDFLSKPVNPIVLEAKLASFMRIRRLNLEVVEKNRALAQHNDETRSEMEVAEQIFERITNQGTLRSGLFRSRLAPASLFNGDLAIACATRSGGQRVLLGDFTGHGLPAAVGALPLSDLFYAMTAKGNSLADLVFEANRKLGSVLPVGMFCAAAIVEIDPIEETIRIWNGGMPDVLMVSSEGDLIERFPSRHIALGVTQAADGYAESSILPLVPGTRIYCFTDGLPEARNAEGIEFGISRAILGLQGRDPFERLLRKHAAFVGEQPLDDDLALLEIDVDRVRNHLAQGAACAYVAPAPAREVPSDWSIDVSFGARALRHNDPVPFLMHAVSEMKIPPETQATLFNVLTELFVNALDHGLLGLDSDMKSTSAGFARYFSERDDRLARSESGTIRIRIASEAAAGGRIHLEVCDDGPGFDHVRKLAEARNEKAGTSLHGRGLALLLRLCESLDYDDDGRCARAVIPYGAAGPA